MNKKIRSIIVDDEESARNVLSALLNRYHPEIEILDRCTNVEEAVSSIKKLNPELVFLDIEMPRFAGYEILNFFDKVEFKIIFVTAYDQYAIKAFELAALDYLLKPIDPDRLAQAIEKYREQTEGKIASEQLKVLKEHLDSPQSLNIILPSKNGSQSVKISSIIGMEAQESYTRVLIENAPDILVSKNLKHFEKSLSEYPFFIRTHKSWIVNSNHMIDFSKSRLEIRLKNNITAKLSKYKKVEFQELITKR